MDDRSQNNTNQEEEPFVFYVSTEEEAMNRAMEKARLTARYFNRSLAGPEPYQEGFSLKARIEDGEICEHIWLTDVELDDDGYYYGTVNNSPVQVTNVSFGSRVLIPKDNVSDWMIVEEGRLIGGYTIRVYRDSLSDEDQEAFDEEMGLYIDFGVDHFEADMSTPEGAIIALEEAYARGDVEGALQCKDFIYEARQMFREVGIDSNYQIVEDTAATLELAFRQFLKEGNFPDFVDVERAFPYRHYLNEDTVVVTEICYFPNGTYSQDRLVCFQVDENQWRVGPPLEEEDYDDEEGDWEGDWD